MDLTLMKPWISHAGSAARRPSGGPSGRPAPSGAGQYDASAKSMAGGWVNGDETN